MYTAFENLELVKTIEKYNDKEKIYKIKNSTKDEFAIIIETMSLLEHNYDVVNCATYNSIEEASKDALMFLDMRKNNSLKTL